MASAHQAWMRARRTAGSGHVNVGSAGGAAGPVGLGFPHPPLRPTRQPFDRRTAPSTGCQVRTTSFRRLGDSATLQSGLGAQRNIAEGANHECAKCKYAIHRYADSMEPAGSLRPGSRQPSASGFHTCDLRTTPTLTCATQRTAHACAPASMSRNARTITSSAANERRLYGSPRHPARLSEPSFQNPSAKFPRHSHREKATSNRNEPAA